MDKQDAYLEELEQQRAQWREEVRQMQNEEEQKYFRVEKSLAPFCTVILFCCFAAYLLLGGSVKLGSIMSYLLWFGSLSVILRYSVKLNHTLDKVCIGLLVGTVFALLFDIFANGYILAGTTAQIFMLAYQAACILGAVCSVYAMKQFWTRRNRIKDMEITNPWREKR
mgnify:CR=1 FL=1